MARCRGDDWLWDTLFDANFDGVNEIEVRPSDDSDYGEEDISLDEIDSEKCAGRDLNSGCDHGKVT